MIIKDASIEDAKRIVEINIDSWINTYSGIFPKEFLNSLNSKKEESIKKCENKINEYLVCEVAGKIVGFLRYGMNKKGFDNNYAEIYAIYVDEEFLKQGIGTKLLKYAFEKLKKDYKFCLVSTLKENSANIFYKKVGGKFLKECEFLLDNNKYVENLYLFKI